MRLTVNGQSREYTGDSAQPLLWHLREFVALVDVMPYDLAYQMAAR